MFFETDVIIGARVDEVWDTVANWTRAASWMSGVEDLRLLERPVGEGARVWIRAGGRDCEGLIVSWEPEDRLGVRVRHAGLTADCELLFVDLDPETRVTLEVSCWGSGLDWRLAALLLGWRRARAACDSLDALKRMIEDAAGRRSERMRFASAGRRVDDEVRWPVPGTEMSGRSVRLSDGSTRARW